MKNNFQTLEKNKIPYKFNMLNMFKNLSNIFKKSESHLESQKSIKSSADRNQETSPYQRNRYHLSKNAAKENQTFLELKNSLFAKMDEQRASLLNQGLIAPQFFRESGKFADERKYFFIKPNSQKGWLFERSGNGWVTSRCEKIQATNTFLRGVEVWDIVTLFAPETHFEAPYRVSSQRYGSDIISIEVYKIKLYQGLGL